MYFSVISRSFSSTRSNSLHPSGSSGTCRMVSNTSPGCPSRMAWRKRSGPTKVAVRQLFNLPHAELLPAQGQDELLDVLLVDPVHAHELPQRVHVGIDRESAAEDLLPHPRAHLCEQPQPHAHPRLAPR